MSLIRTYFSKDTVIVKNSCVNTGANPVVELFHGGSPKKLIISSFKRTLLLYSTFEEFVNAFDDGKNWYNFSGLKYLLYEYEEYLDFSN